MSLAEFDIYDITERAHRYLFLADPASINSSYGQARMQKENAKREMQEKLFAKFASYWRRYGYLPEQVRLNGEVTFLTHIQNDHDDMVKRKNLVYAHKVRAFDSLTHDEVIEISEDAKAFIERSPPSWFYVPASNPFGIHELAAEIERRYEQYGITRAPNQHLVVQGRDLITLVSKAFPYLPLAVIHKACHILGANIKHRLSFAQMLFARIINETSKKSPCSKPCLVIIFRVISYLLLNRISNQFQYGITNYLLIRIGLIVDEPDDLGDYPPNLNAEEGAYCSDIARNDGLSQENLRISSRYTKTAVSFSYIVRNFIVREHPSTNSSPVLRKIGSWLMCS